MSLSSTLATFIADTTFDDLPPAVVDMTQKSILDAIGVSLAASGLYEGCKAFVELAVEMGGRPEGTIFGFKDKVPAAMAAFANGSMAHAMDFEDAHDTALVHANAAGVPTALALAEAAGGVTGKQLITAVAVGCDLVCRLGLALKENNSDNGWYLPPILGAFGATATGCNLLGLNAEQSLNALALTLSQATCSAEFRYTDQSDVRAVRDAFAAKIGVIATQLARKGIRGFDAPFEGKAGFFRLYANDAYDPQALTRNLGRDFAGAETSFKPWPACRGTHTYIEAASRIVEENGLDINAIEAIHLTISKLNRMLCEPLDNKRRPANAIEAKFSLPFTVGTALVHKDVTLSRFFPEAIADPKVLELAGKTTYEVDTTISLRESTRGVMEIRTTDGRRFSKRVDHALGNPSNPMDTDALVQKFNQCAAYAAHKLDDDKRSRLVAHILNLADLEDTGDLMACIST